MLLQRFLDSNILYSDLRKPAGHSRLFHTEMTENNIFDVFENG